MTSLITSDLDRTLIYSAAALRLTGPDAMAPRLLCVEVYESKPLSYMTEAAAALLGELAGHAVFVPATTRTREQYARIRLPGPAPRYAICANGGHLLVDGESDRDWQRAVAARLAGECASLAEIRAHLLDAADPAWLLKERVAEDLFAYLVVERPLLPDDWIGELSAWAETKGWTVSLQGRKVYAVPKPLTKSAAVRELVRRTGAERVLAAGDSLLDADLLLAADHAWRPGHGELADTCWAPRHVTALPERGVAAGEEILRRFTATVTEAGHGLTGAARGVDAPAAPSGDQGRTAAAGATPAATATLPASGGPEAPAAP
ncbi:HAD family hydrolase [Streptomyces spongiicola]|uniref:HAD family hydrolase n=1 Tax=Streptomyces spongiicola TaxID=1690221 RepID=A0ABN5KMY1_9ACTN|nr:HAD family hydrolase [Streptomyces spongiicola]AWK08362.1 HAD family hydrolase [Streptomyces spongiicola]